MRVNEADELNSLLNDELDETDKSNITSMPADNPINQKKHVIEEEFNNQQLGEQKNQTLIDFINENYKIIAVIGVFSAISVYFADRNPVLSLLSFFIIIVIGLDFRRLFPKGYSSAYLMIFDILFSFFLLFLFVDILTKNKELIMEHSFYGFFFLYLVVYSELAERGKFEKINHFYLFKGKWGYYYFVFMILSIDIILSLISFYTLKFILG